MSVLHSKKILLAVTAGIAAYKAAFLVRGLIKKGAQVKVIMTPDAQNFVTPLTLSTLSKHPVEWEFFGDKGDWNNHVEYALWADYMIIAPCTANTLSHMADGTCNNLVLATYLSAKCPVYFAPAMDLDMYKHPSTLENISKLESFGNSCIPAEAGELASGLLGEGRMAEPENIISFLESSIAATLPLYGKKVVVSAGPTYENIDPVRFIGNYSSGKMGFEIAKAATNLGANVTLVSGPSHESVLGYPIERINVVSARDMYKAMHDNFADADVVVMSAAVADYRPKEMAEQKIKKENDDNLIIELVKNPDILKSLGEIKTHQLLVGFALETNNEEEYAKRKLTKKNLDFIVLNSMQDKEAGFQKNTNKITIIDKDLSMQQFDAKSKTEVAKDILTVILNKL
ncbi:bifunctional phosphopantothenoylcysteine decarboxylase/phosphopantothenate--cysteine ligase CoaBC [Empedobacter falsenii]|uniref:Coenzyme A biosynthesis bifunctional protein CoaBC n=2 Tax=Empedobacter TaxID=59734 RepID=A0ABY8V7F3_9FLAO|nr:MULTISPECIES: bifunctional phosphopantothenoylcysteine decarboxylase/phosphopantothenate--cysteine ligase CoaBC [Empedobacter]MCA4782028.1 bifunctional phosphopantothenoylcysteine decarboxylase/phosphopantothenate--cysteine ligase CoaBC [Empedobacter stercoris]MCA4808985.1 bifunctional phosphopantothenoylcysteine decarboxylase/phosphopantothenate--cysteine ligase CoaBC [Empedobacter stercoris]NOJ75214.1 bifunctional phosphopantothenoylcysteine decarboxylase/phosphopantothenate--cysteine ligas